VDTRQTFAVSATVVLLLLGSCATPPPRPVYVRAHRFPEYPVAYHSRSGEVAIHCGPVIDMKTDTCHVLAAGGGEAFGTSVANWLADPETRLSKGAKLDADGNVDFLSHFLGPDATPDDGRLVAGGRAMLPPGIPSKATAAACTIDADGAPHGCRIVFPGLDTVYAKVGLAWLESGVVRFQVTRSWQSGLHVVGIPFTVSQ
jgi:hypothetical protein